MGDENNPGLKPHLTNNTLSINKARRLIMQLAQPLADISQLICDNVYALDQHMKRLNRENHSLADLKRNMFIPVIDIKETQFSEPRTVCADLKCTTTYTVQGRKKCHYSQRCHNPCYLRNVPREIIGSPELLHCAAMHGTTKCQQCGCDYGKHMHIYYETTVYETEIKDDNVVSEITNREGAVKQVEALVKQMKSLKKEREEEHEFIINALATFAWFLKSQAITAYNDAYSTYVGYLIDREKSRGDDADQFAINHLETALRRYEEYKKILDSAKENSMATINAAAITDLTNKLFKLKHCGIAIKKLYEGQSRAHIAETENFEYVHDVGFNLAPEPEPPSPQTNRNNRNSDDTQGQQNRGRNSQNQPKNNNPQKGQNKQQQNQRGNRNKNWRNPQQNQNRWQGQQQPHYQQPPPPLFQQQPPPWQQQPQSYNNYQQRSPQNYYQNPPNYQNYPQGPQFNFSPGGNQQNWPNQMNQGYYPNQQQQFQPPPNQQRYQQQYNRLGPPRRNSFNNEAGPSKESSFEAPTGVYNPKPKKNAERNNTQSLEQQLSSMNVQEPQDRTPTQYDNQNRNGRPRYDSDQHFHQEPQDRTPTQYDNQNRNRRLRYDSDQHFHQIRGRNNFKRNQGRHNNSQQQARNYNKNGDDDDGEDEDNNDTEGPTDGQGYREMRKNDLVKQTVALAVIERSRPSQEGENGASGSSMVTVSEANPEKAISFFRKLFR